MNRYLKRVVERKRTARDSLIKGFAFDELQHEILLTVRLLKTMNRADVRMIQRREHLCFSLKPRQPIRITQQMLRQRLDGHRPIKPRVVRKIHDAHSALAKLRADFVAAEFCAGGECHF